MAQPDKKILIAKFDYLATESHELTIIEGEHLILLDDSLQWWRVVNHRGDEGYVPSNYVRPLKQNLFSSLKNTLTRRKLGTGRRIKFNTPLLQRRLDNSECARQSSMPARLLTDDVPKHEDDRKWNTLTPKLDTTLTSLREGEQIKGPMHGGGKIEVQSMKQSNERDISNEGTPIKHTYNEGSTTPVPSTHTPHMNSCIPEDTSKEAERTENFYCRVVQSYEAQLADELSIRPGDHLHVYKLSADGWWFGALLDRGRPTVTGWFPSNLVCWETSNSAFGHPTDLSSLTKKYIPLEHSVTSKVENATFVHQQAVTLFPYTRKREGELSFQANEILEILHNPANQPDWWFCRNVQGESGWIPKIYAKYLTPPSNMNYGHNTNEVSVSNLKQFTLSRKSKHETAYNVDSELLRMGYARNSRLAPSFLTRPWFWGAISRIECERILRHYSVPGEFIIRDSESDPGNLTLTMNTGKQNRNFKVTIDGGRYHIGYRVFNCIEDLIRHYQVHCIFTDQQQRFLLTQAFVYPGTPELELDRSDYAPTLRPYEAAHPGPMTPVQNHGSSPTFPMPTNHALFTRSNS